MKDQTNALHLARSALEEREQRIRVLEEALRETAQSLAWLSFGECRGYSERLLTSNEALGRARSVLNKEKT